MAQEWGSSVYPSAMAAGVGNLDIADGTLTGCASGFFFVLSKEANEIMNRTMNASLTSSADSPPLLLPSSPLPPSPSSPLTRLDVSYNPVVAISCSRGSPRAVHEAAVLFREARS